VFCTADGPGTMSAKTATTTKKDLLKTLRGLRSFAILVIGRVNVAG
jgi:hypothetical protein